MIEKVDTIEIQFNKKQRVQTICYRKWKSKWKRLVYKSIGLGQIKENQDTRA